MRRLPGGCASGSPSRGAALVSGGLAWLSKLVVATEGRVTAIGAAGVLFTVGLVLILVGSTGVGLRLTINGGPESRAVGVFLSPVVFVSAFMVVQAVVVGAIGAAQAIFGGFGPNYVREQATILLTALASLATGPALIFGKVVRDGNTGEKGADRDRKVRGRNA